MVLTREVFQEKLQEVNQERTQMKNASQSKPLTNAEPLRVPIVESYPDELQQMHPVIPKETPNSAPRKKSNIHIFNQAEI